MGIDTDALSGRFGGTYGDRDTFIEDADSVTISVFYKRNDFPSKVCPAVNHG